MTNPKSLTSSADKWVQHMQLLQKQGETWQVDKTKTGGFDKF